jgi:competence protein ComEC
MTQYLGMALPFWDRSIDIVVATHQHEDHLAGLMSVVRDYDVGLAICPAYEGDSALGTEWSRLLTRREIPLEMGHVQQQLDLGDGALLQVFGPPEPPTSTDCDDNSVVVRLCYGNVAFLLTGDIGSEAERDMCHSVADMDCAVLKVAHHGSDTSSSDQFLLSVSPEIAIVSVGADNAYGHPSSDVLQRLQNRGATVLTTATNGSVECVTDGTSLHVYADG